MSEGEDVLTLGGDDACALLLEVAVRQGRLHPLQADDLLERSAGCFGPDKQRQRFECLTKAVAELPRGAYAGPGQPIPDGDDLPDYLARLADRLGLDEGAKRRVAAAKKRGEDKATKRTPDPGARREARRQLGMDKRRRK